MKRIISINLENAEFFSADFGFHFSNKLNCVMGGRGTGKSTILQFIKSCVELDAEENRETFNILKSNLGSGVIKIEFEDSNGDFYRIEKSIGEEPQIYHAKTDKYVPFDTIRKELTCDIYPAQLIEEIGRNSEARLELLDRMSSSDIEDIKRMIESLQNELEKNAKDIRAHNRKILQKEELLKDLATVEEDLKTHKENTPPDINDSERQEFDKQDAAEKIRASEARFIKNAKTRITELLDATTSNKEEITAVQPLARNTTEFINKSVLEGLIKDIEKGLKDALSNSVATEKVFSTVLENLETTSIKLKLVHDKQHNEFIQLKQKLEKHKVFYDKLNQLSKKADDKIVKQKEIAEIKDKNKKLKLIREKGIKELNGLKKKILDIRLKNVKELNSLFDGKVKITLSPGGITDTYVDSLKNALKGHNMRYNVIIPYLTDNFTPDELARVVHSNDIDKLKEVTGIDSERSKAILDALYESEAIYNIETLYCPDFPEFHLKIETTGNDKSKENYKRSDELSTGQRCTTVLPIVFAISQNPLIIDQPEDNLDNKYISQTIHKIIGRKKDERQLIFITHNANIPVLSDSETNIFLKYNDRKSQIDTQGKVDDVKENILNILEGGKEAFETRKLKYETQ